MPNAPNPLGVSLSLANELMNTVSFINSDAVDGFGEAWELSYEANYFVLNKGGDTLGFNGGVAIVPSLQLAVVALGNGGFAYPTLLGAHACCALVVLFSRLRVPICVVVVVTSMCVCIVFVAYECFVSPCSSSLSSHPLCAPPAAASVLNATLPAFQVDLLPLMPTPPPLPLSAYVGNYSFMFPFGGPGFFVVLTEATVWLWLRGLLWK